MFNKRKKHFKKKLINIDKNIWEKEFQVYQSRKIREEVRELRDRQMETVDALEASLKQPHQPETIKKLEEEKALAQDTAKRYEAQMRMIDEQIEGRPANGEDPGAQGIKDTIASLAEVRRMTKDYIKNL